MFATVEKATLLTLCREAHITSEQLAREARLPVYQIYTVEIGGYCQEEVVRRVIDAYNNLSKQKSIIDEIKWKKATQWDALFSQRGGEKRCVQKSRMERDAVFYPGEKEVVSGE